MAPATKNAKGGTLHGTHRSLLLEGLLAVDAERGLRSSVQTIRVDLRFAASAGTVRPLFNGGQSTFDLLLFDLQLPSVELGHVLHLDGVGARQPADGKIEIHRFGFRRCPSEEDFDLGLGRVEALFELRGRFLVPVLEEGHDKYQIS